MTKFFTIPSLLRIFLASIILLNTLQANAQDKCVPVGWATQNGGTTGGGTATPKVVSNYSDLKSALTSSSDKVVHISGKITIPNGGRITIQDISNKTIIGLPGSELVSNDLSKDGSGIFYIKRCNNFIMRNIKLTGPGAYDTDGYDLLCLDESVNFWVDHCEFHDGMDGNFDIKNKSDFISVTWCTFSYEKPPIANGPGGSDDHRYTNLIGSSDGATGDAGKLKVTFQYCWWGEGCKERMPRVRFGKIHMANNLFDSKVANNCIRAGYKADILVEGNYFDNQKKGIDLYEGDYTGVKGTNNFGASNVNVGTTFTPPYSITVASPASIVTPIKSCAGAKLSSPAGCSSCGGTVVVPDNIPPTVSITTSTNGQQYTAAPASVSITANANDSDGSVTSVEFYNGNTKLSTDNSQPYSYNWTNVAAGDYTIKAVATDNKGATTTATVTIKVVASGNNPPTVTITSPTNGQQFTTAQTSINITANANDSDGSVTSVDFYNGNTKLSTDNSTPYSYNWSNVAAGDYTIKAVATDNEGATTTSTITIKVGAGTNTGQPATLAKRGSGSSTQEINIGEEIVAFYYEWTNANTVSVTGLPEGVTASINTAESRVDISGTPTEGGEFSYAVTTIGGDPEATKTGKITVNGVITGLNNFSEQKVICAPNPFSDYIEIKTKGDFTYEIASLNGTVVETGQGSESLKAGNNLSKGLYIIRVINADGVSFIKVQKP